MVQPTARFRSASAVAPTRRVDGHVRKAEVTTTPGATAIRAEHSSANGVSAWAKPSMAMVVPDASITQAAPIPRMGVGGGWDPEAATTMPSTATAPDQDGPIDHRQARLAPRLAVVVARRAPAQDSVSPTSASTPSSTTTPAMAPTEASSQAAAEPPSTRITRITSWLAGRTASIVLQSPATASRPGRVVMLTPQRLSAVRPLEGMCRNVVGDVAPVVDTVPSAVGVDVAPEHHRRQVNVSRMVRMFMGMEPLTGKRMNTNSLLRSIFLFVCTIVASVTAYGQELEANVNVNVDQLQRDQQVEVRSMANDVRTYLNAQRYSGGDWNGPKVPFDVTIWLLSRTGNQFSARLAVVSKRLVNNEPKSGAAMLRTFDQEWTFEWSFNPTLTYQTTRYDEFTSVLDFYALIALGLDADTYDDLGGTDYYKAALNIAQMGNNRGVTAFRSFYQPGEFTRMALVNELLDLRYTGLRRLFFDYHDAVDLYAKDKAEGRKALALTIGDIATFKRDRISNRSVLLQAFFDAKHLELADIFRGYPDDQLWTDLRFVDPGNTTVYETARNG